jgi:hypothetical protein
MTRNGLARPLMLGGLLATGFAVVWCVFGMWAVEVGAYVGGYEPPPAERLQLLEDGTPVVEVEDRVATHSRRYHDLDGHPVPKPDSDHTGRLNAVQLPAALRTETDGTWEQRIRSFADGGSPAAFWYFLSDGRPDGTGYFAGYDSQSRSLVGHIGTAGFRDGPLPESERFPFSGPASGRGSRLVCTERCVNPAEHPDPNDAGQAARGSLSTWDVYLVGTDGTVWHIDLHERTVHVALSEPGVRSAGASLGQHDPVHGTPHYLAVRTEDSVRVLDERGRELRRYLVPEPLRRLDFGFAEASTGDAVMTWASPFDSLATTDERRIFWVAPDGTYRDRAVVLACHASMGLFQTLGGLVLPSPVPLAGVTAYGRGTALLESGRSATPAEALTRALEEFRPALLLSLAVAAGLAWLCHRRQVRYQVTGPARTVWPLFVLALGLPGWIAFRFGHSWPVLEPCPACHTAVPRDRQECARCAADFPTPELKGTEVFA